MFLPNSHSFLLVRSVISKPVIHPVRGSLAEVSLETRAFGASETSNGIQSGIQEFPTPDVLPVAKIGTSGPSLPDSGKPTVGDKNKRTFLKVAGIAGAGLAASLLVPKKAEALIMGSSPTTGVVGVKNSTNTRINPATEETLDEVLKKTDLTFDTGSLQVKVTSLPDSSFSDSGNVAKKGLVDADRHVQVDVLSSGLPSSASTETTQQTIAFGGKKYALRLVTVGDVDYIAEADTGRLTSENVWRVKKVDSSSGIIITWADGNANFDNYATNLPGLNYL